MTDSERIKLLQTALNEVTYEHDTVSRSIQWFGPVEAVLGVSADEMGRDETSWTSRIHPDDIDAVHAEFARAAAVDRVFDHSYRFLHASGRYIHVHDRGVMTVDAEGELHSVIGILRDVTPTHHAIGELKRAEQLYRRIAAHYNQGGIFLYDRARKVTFAVGQGLDRFGVDPDKLVGHRLADFIDDPALDEIHPHILRAFEGESITLESPFQQSTYIIHISPFREDGVISAALVLTYDISERVEVERALAASERRYRLLAESSRDAIVLMDTVGAIEYANPHASSFFPSAPEDLTGRNITDLFPEGVAERMLQNVAKVVSTGESLSFEAQYPFPKGPRWLNTHLTPLSGEDDVRGVMVVSRDLTAMREAQELRQREREQAKQIEAIRKMVVTIAHEFRNPLAILLNAANLLEQQAYSVETRDELTAKIVKNVRRLDTLVDELIAFRTLDEVEYAQGLRMYNLSPDNDTAASDGRDAPPS